MGNVSEDHGLTWAEFQELTLAQLEALGERRDIELRHARFNAALVTSVLINSHQSAESDATSPYDFVPGLDIDEEELEKQKLRKSIKHSIALAFTQMKCRTPEEAANAKADMLANMRKSGVEDPEGIFREVFPDL